MMSPSFGAPGDRTKTVIALREPLHGFVKARNKTRRELVLCIHLPDKGPLGLPLRGTKPPSITIGVQWKSG